MESIDWNDVNILRKLPDGWYSVPPDTEYGKLIKEDPDIKYNDSVEKAKGRHDYILECLREIDNFIEEERIEVNYEDCTHKNFFYKGYFICERCGLMKRDSVMWVPPAEEGYESRVLMIRSKDKKDNMTEMCDKAKDIFSSIIINLSHDQVTIDDSLDDLMKVFRSYVLTNEDRGRRRFRVSASPEGLCAALLWRKILLRKIPMTMLEFSRRTKVDRMTISTCFSRLDDYKDLHVSKRGRPKRK